MHVWSSKLDSMNAMRPKPITVRLDEFHYRNRLFSSP
jgi:hypothetical protein